MAEQEFERQASRAVWTVAVCFILVFGLAVWDWVCQKQADRPETKPEPAAVSEPQLAGWLLEKMDRESRRPSCRIAIFPGRTPCARILICGRISP